MTNLVGSEAGLESRDRRMGERLFFRSGGRKTVRDVDVVFDVLSDRRRRIVLDYLRDHEGEWVSTGTLADRVASWEFELHDPASVSVESIEIDLVHGHLPKLDEAGLIDCDGSLVRYRGDDRVERFLDLSRREGSLP